MNIVVPEEFIFYRNRQGEIYNQRGRTDRRFMMDIDCELLEWYMIDTGQWLPHESWMVDAINEKGHHIDVKFIRKYWNVSREKTLNLIKQRNILDGYSFFEWLERPARPLRAGDAVRVGKLGYLSYSIVADNLRKSFKEPDGFYVDVHKLFNQTV